jgi:hypothetical protein
VKELNTAVRARLIGDEDLTGWPTAQAAQVAFGAALGKEKDGVTPSIRKTFSGTTPAVVPCVTFRSSAGAIDGRVADGLAVGDPIIDMEIWVDRPNQARLSDIEQYLLILLDMRLALVPALPLSSGICWWTELFVEPFDDYDKDRNLFYELVRFRCKTGRTY